ncbi:uncharacterized protein EI97DRAFT_463623 [Westerdykella ornata]|uniref:Uncharacterized protein n=1 Tax=Westerdykella ornata TaxID=318751 RepID=A0A6A6JYU1_WESOR|nr:uncharacterized protein EI97DRAFT_463623 [Westerdykella ornata]KAF2281263.1 hypothetical protein EI97DRAFT_463623 [Westerdykella ornata]
MRRTGSGRVARKIGAYDEDDNDTTSPSDSTQSAPTSKAPSSEPVVKRPTFAKSRKRSSLRISFGAGESDEGRNDGGAASDSAVVTPKKTSLSRVAMEKNAERRARSPLVPDIGRAREEERPSYSKDYLEELKKSTPSTPRDLVPSAGGEAEEETRAIDIASKFGPDATLAPVEPVSLIPTAAEIQEKKARRARLAKEQLAAADDEEEPWASDDSDAFRTMRNEISLRPKEKEKYAETRLVRDDEDIAEGFEEYVEDGRISLSRKAEREAERRRRAEMAEMISQAERGSDEEGPSDSEEERNAAYEAAQTRAGAYGRKEHQEDEGARTPPRITPLPDLSEVLESLQADVTAKRQHRDMIFQKLQEVREEKVRIADRQKYVQEKLQETGEEYERLRIEAGMVAAVNGMDETGKIIVNRGLDSLGTTPGSARGLESIGATPAGGLSRVESDDE